VNVCFHYVGDYDWYAQVDDVSLTCNAAPPTQVELVETTSEAALPFDLLLGVAVVGLLVVSSVAITVRRVAKL